MKKILLPLFSMVFLSAQAQTADEVVREYSAVMGGLEAFAKVTTARITGTLSSQGRDIPLTTQIVNGKSMRSDLVVGEQSVHSVYDNGTGWKINPFANAPTATDVTGSELVTFKAQASLANNLMDYKNRGHKIELLGAEEVDGAGTFKIKLTGKEDGKITTYFISSTSYLLVKSVAKREIAGTEYDAETYYTELKEIGGLKFCMHFTTKIMGKVFQEVKYAAVELNVPIDENIFVKPE
jgi:hypothetical protein